MAVQRHLLQGVVMTHSVESHDKTAKARPTRARAKEARVEQVVQVAREAKATLTACDFFQTSFWSRSLVHTCKINPRTGPFRRRGVLLLKLGLTIHDQKATMFQSNFRMRILWRATTQLEQDRVSEAHIDCDLRLARRPRQGLVIAIPWATRSLRPPRIGEGYSSGQLLFCTPMCQTWMRPCPTTETSL